LGGIQPHLQGRFVGLASEVREHVADGRGNFFGSR